MSDETADWIKQTFEANQKQGVGQAVVSQRSASPDAAARANVLSRQTGLPADTVERNYQQVDTLTRARQTVDEINSGSPYLKQWYSDPRNAASAHDDAPTLKKLSDTQSYWQRALANQGSISAPKPVEATLGNYLWGLWQNVKGTLGPGGTADSALQLMTADTVGTLPFLKDTIGPNGMPTASHTGATVANARQNYQIAQQQIDQSTPDFQTRTAKGIYSGMSSFVQQIPGLAAAVITKNPTAALGWGGSLAGVPAYGKYRARGATPGQAAIGGAGEGAIEVATEMLPTHYLLNALTAKAGKSFAVEFGKSMLAEIPGEQVATLGQDAIDTAIANPNTKNPWAKYWQDRPGAAYDTLIATLTQGAITGGIGGVSHLAARQLETQGNAAVLDGVMQDAEASKLRARDPEAFSKFLAGVVQDTPIENVYVPGEAVRDLMQGQHHNDPFWGQYASQIDEAAALGGDVVLPLADVATHLAGTPGWEALRHEMRFSPGGMSQAELASLAEHHQADVEMVQGRLAEAAQNAVDAAAPAMQVYSGIRQQLQDAGFAPDQADAYAQAWTANREAWASRLGTDAYSYHAANPVQFNRILPTALSQVQAADGLDIVINALRNGKEAKPKTGRSLLEWIASKGGIEDPGGDIASMGGATWHKEKAFRKRLLKDSNAAQGNMLGGATSANSIDNLFGSAVSEGYFPDLVARREGGEALDSRAFLDAIGSELRGNPVYAQTQEQVDHDANVREAADELGRILSEQGVDPATAKNSEIKKALEVYREDHLAGRALGQSVQATVSQDTAPDEGLGPASMLSFQPKTGDPGVSLVDEGDGFISAVYRDESGNAVGAVKMPITDEGREINPEVSTFVKPAFRRKGIATRLYDALRDAGYDVDALSGTGDITPNGAAFINARRALNQSMRGRVSGGLVSGVDGPSIIDLFENSDLSTVIHESGHVWLEELKRNAALDGAPQDVVDDWDTVKQWFADQGHPVEADGFIPTEAHELWARGIERHALEGKAPSSALSRVFNSFRAWLLTIYKHVANLNTPITDEVRRVMDRLYATQQAIDDQTEAQAARALFTDAAQAGMTEAEFAAYQQATVDARSEAYDALLYRTMAAIRAERTKLYKEQERSVRAEVSAEIDQRPDLRALHLLRTGEWLGEPEREGLKVKIDRQWLLTHFGTDALGLMPKSVPPIFKEDGQNPDDIANMLGYENGEQMVQALMGLQQAKQEMNDANDKRSVRQRLIDEGTQSAMDERYGDPLNDGSIEQEAITAINNNRHIDLIASEARALGRQRGMAPTPARLARDWAARKIAEGRVVDVASRAALQRYARAAAKAARSAEDALVRGDVDEAFRQKQAQLLNASLLSEAGKAADMVDKAVERMSKIARRATMKSVDQDYLDRAHALLEKFDFRTRSQKSIKEQLSFTAWADQQRANGVDVITPPRLEDQGVHYTRMSVEELQGLDASVGQIIHLGRLKQKLLDAKEEREFDAVVAEAVAAAGELRQRAPSDLMSPSWGERISNGIASADAALLKMEQVFDWLDGGKSDGVFHRVVFRPIAEAQDRENDMLADYLGNFRRLLEAIPKETLKRWDERIQAPELINRDTGNPWVFTRQQLIAIALNMGNAGNIQRLTDGYRWSENGVRQALGRELTAPEWEFVQSTWDLINGLWPETAALEKRVNGVEPDKVEAVAFDTPHGTFAGGYYPAIYDATKDLNAERNQGESNDLFSSAYTRANTTAAATKDRANKVTRPVLLDLGVITRHLTEVIHDITHREAVMNADKFLSSNRVSAAVDASLGREIRQQFRPWLKFIANRFASERAGNEGLGKWINKLRANATVVGMGFRISTILSQLAGYSNSAEVVGAKWIGHGIAAFAKSPVQTFNFAMDRSGELRHRMDTLDRDIGTAISQLSGEIGAWTAAKRFAFHGIGYMDRAVAVPTWLGAYAKAVEAGASEQDAIYEGDKAIRLSQGSGAAKDLPAVQRGTGKYGELLKLMTMYYSYVATVYQRQRTLARDVGGRNSGPRDLPKLAARSFFLLALPPVLAEILSGRGPGDDEDWGWWAFEKMLAQGLGPIPGVRDLVQPIYDALRGKRPHDYQISPLQAAGQSLVISAVDAHHVLKGEETKSLTRDTLQTVGYTTGLVPGQLASATQFFVAVASGDQNPHTVADWYKGITTGKVSQK